MSTENIVSHEYEEELDISTSKYDIISVDKMYEQYYSNTKITKPYITRFEKAKILSVRAQQISEGAEIMVTPGSNNSPKQIALLEFQQKKIPLLIRRYLPNGKYEDWRLTDLQY